MYDEQSSEELLKILLPELIKETRIFNSFAEILSKSQKDGYIDSVYTTFNTIIEKEKVFALQRFLNRAEKTEK